MSEDKKKEIDEKIVNLSQEIPVVHTENGAFKPQDKEDEYIKKALKTSSEELTLAQYKAAKHVNEDLSAALVLSYANASIPYLKENTGVQQTTFKANLGGRDKLEATQHREKTFRNPATGEEFKQLGYPEIKVITFAGNKNAGNMGTTVDYIKAKATEALKDL